MKIILITAMSLDGKIAKNSRDPVDWTSKEDKSFFARETKKVGVVMMGSNTYRAIGEPLPQRLNIVFTSQTKSKNRKPNLLEFTSESPQGVIKSLEKRGFQKAFLLGGTKLNTSFLKAGLINEIWVTMESVILGKGLSLFHSSSYNLPLTGVVAKKLGTKSLLLKYRIEKNK